MEWQSVKATPVFIHIWGLPVCYSLFRSVLIDQVMNVFAKFYTFRSCTWDTILFTARFKSHNSKRQRHVHPQTIYLIQSVSSSGKSSSICSCFPSLWLYWCLLMNSLFPRVNVWDGDKCHLFSVSMTTGGCTFWLKSTQGSSFSPHGAPWRSQWFTISSLGVELQEMMGCSLLIRTLIVVVS